ncbi:unnamed protein product [Effrenium voratum]|uniref:Uncharacterized protein n=1 Tax=Effrenium voratum TaxID=2562239 RepID=A0AA36J1A2_9DINO|nr:unnamed protein product [Effrenium voratum]CAJ1452667.1 unnamed protein product [Effrenium voratum]
MPIPPREAFYPSAKQMGEASALQAPSDLPHVAAKMEQLDGVDTANRPLPPPMDMPRMVSDLSEPISGMPDCKDEMLEATEKVDRFAKVHFRAMVFIKFLGLLALASLLAVEWVSEVRTREAERVTELSGLGEDVQLYDLVLTSSARFLVLTGDVTHRDMYWSKVEPLEHALNEIKLKAPEISAEFDGLTVEANDKLIALEDQAFQLASSGNLSAARELMFGAEYKSNKDHLLHGLSVLDGLLEESRQSQRRTQEWWTYLSTVLVLVAFCSELLLVVLVHRLDRRLELLSISADVQKSRYELQMRKGLLTTAQATLSIVKMKVDQSMLRSLTVPHFSDDHQPRLLMRRRLYVLSMMAEGLALCGFAIPATLTLIALNSVSQTQPIQQLILHAKATEYYDLALTSSAQLCVLTGDGNWSKAYDDFVAPMDATLLGLSEVAPQIAADFASSTAAANTALIDMETLALSTCVTAPEQGRALLFSPEYTGNKTLLLSGISTITSAAETALANLQDSQEEHENTARILLIVSTFLIVAADLCTVVIAAWMEALSVSVQEGDGIETERRFVDNLLKLIQVTWSMEKEEARRLDASRSLPVQDIEEETRCDAEEGRGRNPRLEAVKHQNGQGR